MMLCPLGAFATKDTRAEPQQSADAGVRLFLSSSIQNSPCFYVNSSMSEWPQTPGPVQLFFVSGITVWGFL